MSEVSSQIKTSQEYFILIFIYIHTWPDLNSIKFIEYKLSNAGVWRLILSILVMLYFVIKTYIKKIASGYNVHDNESLYIKELL